MKHFSLFSSLSLLFVLSTAFTCTDHRDLPAPAARFRVKTINCVRPGGYTEDGVYTLFYNSSGQLLSFTNERDAYKTTRHGLLTYYTGDVKISSNKNGGPTDSYGSFYYFDAQNRLIKIMYFHNSNVLLIYDFTYDSNSTNPSSRVVTRYENGLPTGNRTEIYTFTGGNATSINGNNYTYDSSPNPYKDLFGLNAFALLSPDYFLSDANNIALKRPFNISERFSDSSVKAFNQNNRTTDAQLTYNSDGLVEKITYNNGNSEEFTYETY